MNMKNNVSTNVVKLDLGVILANFKNPKFWQKQWTIIDTSEIKIVWHISSIDCVNGKIKSALKVLDKNFIRDDKNLTNAWYCDESIELPPIPINNCEYTQKHFENALYGRTIALLKDVERHLIYEYAEYKQAEKVRDQVVKELEDIANAFLDSEHVTNKYIRNAYIEKYLEDNEDESKLYIIQVVNNYQYKVITNAYIYTAAWFDNMEDYAKYNNIAGTSKDSIRWTLWNKIKEIQTDSWKKSMEAQLKKL